MIALGVLTLAVATPASAGPEPVFEVEAVNPTLPPLDDPPNLETPQACVESFVAAGRRGHWRRAAASMHFRLIEDVDVPTAERLARQLYYVLNQELWIDWNALPDRIDGVAEHASGTTPAERVGAARRSILLGEVPVDGRDVPIRIERVRAPETEPVWLFAAHTVDNVERLYAVHGPSLVASRMPDWARRRGPGRIPLWQWIGLAALVVTVPLVARGVAGHVCRRLARTLSGDLATLTASLEWPLTAVTATTMTWVVLKGLLGLPSTVAAVAEPLTMILAVLSAVWLAMRIVSYAIGVLIEDAIRHEDEEETAETKRLLTQITVARQVVLLLVGVAGLSVILLQLGAFRTLGITLLSSAGAAAVILGIAGHAVLGNLVAGVQIAIMQPFRLDDTVYIEGNWGRIEKITYVNVIVRTWDHRRLVFPIRYFVNEWFENWSRDDPYLKRGIYLRLDYRSDVQAVREKFLEIVEADDDCATDRDQPEVLVTECDDETLKVRLTCGAADPSAAWSLECRVREKMLAWLRREENEAFLPRRRILLSEAEATD